MWTKKKKDYDKEYLLKEFDLLEKLRSSAINQSSIRVEHYFLIVSAFIAGVTWYFKNDTPDVSQNGGSSFIIAILIIDIVLLLIGFLSFFRLLEAHFSIVTYTRGLNRIRGYFSHEKDNSLFSDALLLPKFDDEPEYGGFAFGRSKVFILGQSGMMLILVSILVGFLSTLIHALTISKYILNDLIITGISGFFLSSAFLALVATYMTEQKKSWFKKKYGIKFPNPNSE